MARKPREKSPTGLYHVMLKGAGNQVIFEDSEDRYQFIFRLQRFKKELQIDVYVYCLMENHVHLLINDQNDKLSLFMQKVQLSYCYYFNHKYDREGSLFYGRFQSEVIKDDEYLLTAFRYILKNPEKAGIEKCSSYKWSSYSDYFSNKKTLKITDTDRFEKMLQSKKNFNRLLANSSFEHECLEIGYRKRFCLKDENAIEFIHNNLKISSCTLIKSFSQNKRNEIICELKNKGVSIRQIERLTGIGRGIIQAV